MKKVFIKYNPYKLETEITVEGKPLAENSKIKDCSKDGTRLQEWVESLPELLVNEFNDKAFNIIFHGTESDYDDLYYILSSAYDRGIMSSINLEHKDVKETGDKEKKIDALFKKIQSGPFKELCSDDIKRSFELAKSSEFEVCVVATMSAGKSTLINAMLSDALMPSKAEACTAIITRIKDNDDNTGWKAVVYDKDGKIIETDNKLNIDIMTRLNSDNRVSQIDMTGNIPFVNADDMSLVLIDTPGPNNMRDLSHREVQEKFLNKSSKSLVLYVMEATFGNDSDDALLKKVAKSMEVGGKQSKDRFIFAVNKMDSRKKEDGSMESTLNNVKEYLKGHGIENPNLFPVAALPALNIRLMQSNKELDVDTIEDTETAVRKLNRSEQRYLERYAVLPQSCKDSIDEKVKNAHDKNDPYEEALYHTGIPSVEMAISQYVEKYAKTAKIKNIVDTFIHKLDEVGCFEQTKNEISSNKEEARKIIEKLEFIKKNLENVKTVRQFETNVNNAVNKVANESSAAIKDIVVNFQKKVTMLIDKVRGKELEIENVKSEIKQLEKFAKELEPEFRTELGNIIQKNVINTGESLLNEYRKKLSAIAEQANKSGITGIKIDTLNLMSGSINSNFSYDNLKHSKEVKDGEIWVENEKKRWYKPWTWLQESGHYEDKYKTVSFIKADELAQAYLAPVQKGIYDNADMAIKHSKKQSEKIANNFKEEFKRLDNVLKSKLSELEKCATDQKNAEKRIKESEAKLKWLENIRSEVNSILEI